MEATHVCLHEKDWDKKAQEEKDLKDSIIEILTIHNLSVAEKFNAMERATNSKYNAMEVSINDKFENIEKRMNKDSSEAKEAIRAALEAQKETVTVALTASDKAALKAETAFEKRFDGIMELINNVVEQIKLFIPRQEAEGKFFAINARMDLLATDIGKIRDVQSQGTGEKDGIKSFWGFITGAVGVVVGIIAIALTFIRK